MQSPVTQPGIPPARHRSAESAKRHYNRIWYLFLMACGAVRLTGLSVSRMVLNWPAGCRKPLFLGETILGLVHAGSGGQLRSATVHLLGRRGKIFILPTSRPYLTMIKTLEEPSFSEPNEGGALRYRANPTSPQNRGVAQAADSPYQRRQSGRLPTLAEFYLLCSFCR